MKQPCNLALSKGTKIWLKLQFLFSFIYIVFLTDWLINVVACVTLGEFTCVQLNAELNRLLTTASFEWTEI